VQVFDSWAGILGPSTYAEFSQPYIAQITAALGAADAVTATPAVPVTVFALGAWFATNALAALPGVRTVGLDWHHDAAAVRASVGPTITLQGNLDPATLYGSFDSIRKETRRMLAAFQGGPHIANLGHGVYPDTNPDHVRCFVDTVKGS
jgi:uroporphyrinogen decarboxylase